MAEQTAAGSISLDAYWAASNDAKIEAANGELVRVLPPGRLLDACVIESKLGEVFSETALLPQKGDPTWEAAE